MTSRRNYRRTGTTPQAFAKASNSIDQHVGARVRNRRMMLGLSKPSLGDAIGVTSQQIKKYENGKNRISASRLQHIAEILQISVDYFFEGAPRSNELVSDAASYAAISEFLALPEAVAMMRALERIENAALRRSIIELIERIADSIEPDASSAK
jgi:transcriptional regulator with XRE-family HTH domain